jgi:hypothetical protein
VVSPRAVDDAAVDDCATIEPPRSVAATDAGVEDVASLPAAPADSIWSIPLLGFASFAAQPDRAKTAKVSA